MPSIGDKLSGGTFFYSGATGGLIAANNDLPGSYYWGCYKTGITGTSTDVGTGQANTNLIITGCTTNVSIAANMCNNAVIDGYSDWYLPSKDELNYMYQQKSVIGDFSSIDNYWSSSQYTPECAWMQYFGSGVQSEKGDKDQLYKVRPIRTY